MHEISGSRQAFHGAVIGLTALITLSACFTGCSGTSEGGSFLSDLPSVQRYERRIVTRPDGSRLTCFISRSQTAGLKPLVFFCQGSGYASQFEERPMGGYLDVNSWVWERSGSGQQIRFAFVEKRGVPFGTPMKGADEVDPPEEFLLHDTRDSRVSDILWALDVLAMEPSVDKRRIALLGHGQGAALAAEAARKSPHVTHLGYFSAGGQPRLVELLFKKRLELNAEGLDAAEAEEKMNEFFGEVEEIFADPEDYSSLHLGSTPLHITTTGLSTPMEDMLALEIPIFVAIGSANPVVPMASVDLIRLEFIRHGHENLDFRVYPGLDHGFIGPDPDEPEGDRLFQLPMVFDEFCAWLME